MRRVVLGLAVMLAASSGVAETATPEFDALLLEWGSTITEPPPAEAPVDPPAEAGPTEKKSDEILPNWRLDIGSSFGVWGWDGGPFKIGRATVQAVVNYKIMTLAEGLELQAGWITGTVLGNIPTATVEESKAWYVSGPSAGLRYADLAGGNLFVARLGDEGEYADVTYWAVGINLTLNPAKLLAIAKQAIWGVESKDSKSAPVAWLKEGAVEIYPGVYKRI